MAKNHLIRVKVSQEQLQKIRTKAEEAGLKPSVFLRMLGLGVKLKINYENEK